MKALYGVYRNTAYRVLARVMPRGWYDQSLATLAEWWEENWLSRYDRNRRRVRLSSHDEWVEELREAPYTNFNYLARLAMSQLTDFYGTAAKAQTRWDLFRVVCGLQRYRLVHGEFPQNLHALVEGGFLKAVPMDYVTGEPPNYQSRGEHFSLAALMWDSPDKAIQWFCQVGEHTAEGN